MDVARSVRIDTEVDRYFREYTNWRHGSVWGHYSKEVENAMVVEMAWWGYTPSDEAGFLKRVKGRLQAQRRQTTSRVLRVVRLNPGIDEVFKSFTLLAFGRLWGCYSQAVESGMVLLMLLSRFRPLEEKLTARGLNTV
jgi:hypothetical protein